MPPPTQPVLDVLDRIDKRQDALLARLDAFDARMEQQFIALGAKIDALRWFVVAVAVVVSLAVSAATKLFA